MLISQHPMTISENGLCSSFDTMLNLAPRASQENKRRPHLREWDKGVFASELIKQSIFPRALEAKGNEFITPTDNLDPIAEGTYHGSKKAATEMYHRIEQRFASYFDLANFASTVPQLLKRDDKRNLFRFQKLNSDNYPPHLDLVPDPVTTGVDFLQIFNFMRLLDTGLLLPRIIPEKVTDFIHEDPDSGTMARIEKRNQEIRAAHKDIGKEANIGDRPDWYTDAVFAQQQFTGPNPTTITQASVEWINKFRNQARLQRNHKAFELMAGSDSGSFYIQDYSYFRQAMKAAPDADLVSDDGKRFSGASVCLFQLNDDGKLHPIAIIIDYKGSMEKSVVTFNKRLHASDPTTSEATDWPWRYAKMCMQVSDWTCHELAIHLTNTHLVEEVIIVAAHRTLPTNHIVYRLLEPHWLKTLPLNAAARSALVPGFIVEINGISTRQTYDFIKDAYKRFDWRSLYIPHDLESRGFPLDEIHKNSKYHNYPYARNMHLMWNTIQSFVSTAVTAVYKSDAQVLNDPSLQAFSLEMRHPLGGYMPSFPELKSISELIDMITMSIHIASPQHNAVNYLQNYYMSFIPNKPASLCTPLPTSLSTLNTYTEKDLLRALPINQSRVWLMSSHLPYLLNSGVADEQTLLNYALSLHKLSGQGAKNAKGDPIADASEGFLGDLEELKGIFEGHSEEMDDASIPYLVMDPASTAISILI